ncbi:hypothetical protein [Candidatus Thiosymbion oneisti]|uniref:hypothetical protein n=1 Tax=Candidatus Thiosymbion oneisti TaxID=589554 RepID=UPI0013FDD2F2|nr:hypothetical protein [Candidatus Thiosymbion oneisti]
MNGRRTPPAGRCADRLGQLRVGDLLPQGLHILVGAVGQDMGDEMHRLPDCLCGRLELQGPPCHALQRGNAVLSAPADSAPVC